MPLRSGGLASGLDTNTLIRSLVDIERTPIRKLQRKKSGFENQISLIGKIKSSLKALEDKAKALDTATELVTMTATSSAESSFTASANGAAPASYALEIGEVAAAEKNRSDGFASGSAVKAGTLSIAVKGGASQDVTIADGDSINDVMAKINDTVTGVTAAIISDGTSSYLSVTANETGHTIGGLASDAVTITETYTGGTGGELNLVETQTAKNAQITIDGLAVESESNSIQSALTGVTISVLKKTTQAETLTVKTDNTAVEASIQEFVDAYNDAIGLVMKQVTVTAGTDRSSTLAGDPTIRSMRGALSDGVNFPVASLSGATYDSLASIGIKTNSDGTLELKSADLQKALEADGFGVSKIFTASDGVMARMKDVLDPYTAVDGILVARTDGLNDNIKNIDGRIERLELRVEKYEENLVKQFTALELTISSLQDQGNFLAGALPKLSSS